MRKSIPPPLDDQTLGLMKNLDLEPRPIIILTSAFVRGWVKLPDEIVMMVLKNLLIFSLALSNCHYFPELHIEPSCYHHVMDVVLPLFACKATRTIAQQVFYEHNTFITGQRTGSFPVLHGSIPGCILNIPRDVNHHIRKLEIRGTFMGNYWRPLARADYFKSQFPSLKQVTLKLEDDYWDVDSAEELFDEFFEEVDYPIVIDVPQVTIKIRGVYKPLKGSNSDRAQIFLDKFMDKLVEELLSLITIKGQKQVNCVHDDTMHKTYDGDFYKTWTISK